jgi:hypothetical protein
MDEPKRYGMTWHLDDDDFVYVSPKELPNGQWVRWDDYARLKAEVDRLTPLLGNIVSFDEYFKLLQQVERLTKAGDNMYSWIGVCGRHNNSTGDDWLRAKKGLPLLIEQWEIQKRNRLAKDAAREGKQSNG